MGHLAVVTLRVVLVLACAGSLLVQAVLAAVLANELSGAGSGAADATFPVVVIVVLGIVTVQVCAVCVWRLLTMVRRGTVFSSAAFRYVDIITAAIASASLLTFGLGFVLAPGEAVPPEVVLLVGGAGVLVAGIALIVLVQRMLLAQAVARDTEASTLRAELDEVI